MRIEDYLSLAKNSLFHRKLRSWLTVLGVIIGIASVVGLVSIGQGFEHSINEQLNAFGGNAIFISPGRMQAGMSSFGFGGRGFGDSQALEGRLTENDVNALRGIHDLESIDGIISDRADVYFRGQKASVNIQGTTTNLWRIFNIVTLEQGRFFSSSESRAAVVGNIIAKDLFEHEIKLGDLIVIDNSSFRVIGIMEPGSGIAASMIDNAIVIPKEDARKMFQNPGDKEVSSIIAKAADNADMVQVEKNIELRLRASHNKAVGQEDFTVMSSESVKKTVGNISAAITLFLGGIAAISLLVGAIGIANTMFMSVIERTRQIGILKALGAKNKEILNIFLIESSLLGLIGGIIGVAIGFVFGFALSAVSLGSGSFAMRPAITIELVLFAILFSIIIGALSGLFPAKRASALEPVDALRYE